MIGVFEAILCDNCNGLVYSCQGCGRDLAYAPRLGAAIGPWGNCYDYYIRDRLSWLSEADREAIRRLAPKHGALRAADEAMRLLSGWPSPEAIAAVLILRGEGVSRARHVRLIAGAISPASNMATHASTSGRARYPIRPLQQQGCDEGQQ